MNKFKRFFILGKPLTGKSTICKKIANIYNINHFSIGNYLRKCLIDPNINIKIKNIINNTIKQGILLSNENKKLILNKLIQQNKNQTTIFDGFPRTMHDVEDMRPYNKTNDIFIYLNLDNEEIKKRLKMRKYCIKCSTSYKTKNNKSNKCIKCKIMLKQREDDNIQTLLKRLKTYNKEQPLVIQYLKNQKININIINAKQSEQLIIKQIKSIINNNIQND